MVLLRIARVTPLRVRRGFAFGRAAALTSRALRDSPRTSPARMRLRTEMDSSIAGGRDARDHNEDLMHG